MKNTLVLLIMIFIEMGQGTIAHAFYLQQQPIGVPTGYSPYPLVLSQKINILPPGAVTITVDDETYYYAKGIFYQKVTLEQKYLVVPPPIGAVVFDLPQGCQMMLIDGISYYEYQGVYYRRVLDGYKVIFPPVA